MIARWAAALAPALSGLVASTMLLVDYLRPAPAFCEEGGGCEAVRRTVYAAFFGIPTPVFGVIAFLVFGAMALARGPRVRFFLVIASALGTCFALFLLGVQAILGQWCPFCVVADLSMCLTVAAAFWRYDSAWDPAPLRAQHGAAGLALATALGVPLAVGFTKKARVPDAIASEIAQTPDHKVTVIDFVDYECPFCRLQHAELAVILAAHADRVHVVRKQVPFTRIHPHALDAARAACCAEILGKGDAMTDALFAAPIDDLTPDGCEKIALSLGIDKNAYEACLEDPKTEARLRADMDEFRAAKGNALPTLWIDVEKLVGAQPHETLERAITTAIARKS